MPYDALLAGFGEHGRDGPAELLDVPVFDIAECAAIIAQPPGRTYSLVTTLQRSVAAIDDRPRMAGLAQRCGSVRVCGLGVPVVDAVAGGVRPAEAVVGLGPSTRKVYTNTTPEPNTIVGWPLSDVLPGTGE